MHLAGELGTIRHGGRLVSAEDGVTGDGDVRTKGPVASNLEARGVLCLLYTSPSPRD